MAFPIRYRASGAGAALIVALLAAACSETPTEASPTPHWRATHVNGAAVPAAMYVFDPEEVDGRIVSIHLIVDSARLAIQPTGQYVHRVFVSEWEGLPGGGPLVRRLRLGHYDHGSWQRTGSVMELESGYLQNHRMTGSYEDDVLRLQHGFTPGDPLVEVRYGQRR